MKPLSASTIYFMVLALPQLAACGHTPKVDARAGVTRPGCPPSGSRVRFADLLGHAHELTMCDLVTEVAYVGEGTQGVPLSLYAMSGQMSYRVLPPGAAPQVAPNGSQLVNYVTLPKRQLKPMRDVQPGAILMLRGFMDYRRPHMGQDQGQFSRVFRAHSFEVIPAPTIPEPAAPALPTVP